MHTLRLDSRGQLLWSAAESGLSAVMFSGGANLQRRPRGAAGAHVSGQDTTHTRQACLSMDYPDRGVHCNTTLYILARSHRLHSAYVHGTSDSHFG